MVDFTKLRTLTPEEVAAIPAEKPDPEYIRRNTELKVDKDEKYEDWVKRRAEWKGFTPDELLKHDLDAVARADERKFYLTEQQVLNAHAEFGQMDKEKIKAAMGPNWPAHWDDIAPGGSGIFSS